MRQPPAHEATTVWTVGHSTRTLEVFVGLLQAQQIGRVVDVRTVPRSRHNPQFNKENLPESLRAAGIAYQHMPALGGLRHPRADSPNMGWRNASFRGYADYMQTDDFAESLKSLMGGARKERVALMCAEAVPWRCHRSLIADALSIRGVSVEHIISGARTQTHVITPWACVQGERITYPGEEAALAEKGAPDHAAPAE
jgi:uncharacterized protein (DUF488 family)